MEEVVGSIPTRSTNFNYLQTLRISVWWHLASNHHKPFRFHGRGRRGSPTRLTIFSTICRYPAFQFGVNLASQRCDCFRCLEEVVGAIQIRSTILIKQCQLGVVRCFHAGQVVLACRLHVGRRRFVCSETSSPTKAGRSMGESKRSELRTEADNLAQRTPTGRPTQKQEPWASQ